MEQERKIGLSLLWVFKVGLPNKTGYAPDSLNANIFLVECLWSAVAEAGSECAAVGAEHAGGRAN